jgi:hypothetical protein
MKTNQMAHQKKMKFWQPAQKLKTYGVGHIDVSIARLSHHKILNFGM